MLGRKLSNLGIASIALASAAFAAPASATVIEYVLDDTVEGDTPSGFPTMRFDDGGSSGSVDLTIDATGLSGGEYLASVFFNFANAGSQTLTFARSGGTGPLSGFTFGQGSNDQDSPGNQGQFDISIAFTESNANSGLLRFNAGETLIFTITGAGITANDFALISAPEGPNGGDNFALARVRGIEGGGSASVADSNGPDRPGGEEPVPEPAALGLLGLGVLALGLRRRGQAG